MHISEGEVWLVNFPLEEDPAQFLVRPVIVLNVETLEVLSVKVTRTKPRQNDKYDVRIIYWKEAELKFRSTARISKTMYISKTQFIHRIGILHEDDLVSVQNLFIKLINSQS